MEFGLSVNEIEAYQHHVIEIIFVDPEEYFKNGRENAQLGLRLTVERNPNKKWGTVDFKTVIL